MRIDGGKRVTPPGRGVPSFIAALAAACCVGCILLAPDAVSVSPECGFRGRGSECGACLAAHCDSVINAACADSAIITPLEQCAADGTDACGKLPASAVATCLAQSCAAVCYQKIGASQTSCTDAFLAPGLACSCELSPGHANDLACSNVNYPRTRCCAPASWPGPALQCTCNAVTCVPTTDGCNCVLGDNLDSATAEECRGPHCCAVEDRCQCRQRACEAGEREVSVCNRAELSCPTGQREVTSCAIRQ